MSPLTARELAHHLIAREQDAGRAPPDVTAAAERVVRRLADELTGWFGPYGARALLARALADVQGSHPALGAVRVSASSSPELDGLTERARIHGADAVAAGVVELLAALVELLGRMIGDELAMTLMKQSVRNGPADRAMGGGDLDGSATEERAVDDAASTSDNRSGRPAND